MAVVKLSELENNMAYKDNMNSNDNYGETNRVPAGSNEEKIRQAAQRTTGSLSVIKNNMGAANERGLDKTILGFYDTLN